MPRQPRRTPTVASVRNSNAERDRLLVEARLEAETLRSSLTEAARAEIKAKQSDWRSDLEEEQEGFLRNLRRQTEQEFLTLARRALADLANASLESQVVAVFLDKLGDLDQPGEGRVSARRCGRGTAG